MNVKGIGTGKDAFYFIGRQIFLYYRYIFLPQFITFICLQVPTVLSQTSENDEKNSRGLTMSKIVKLDKNHTHYPSIKYFKKKIIKIIQLALYDPRTIMDR